MSSTEPKPKKQAGRKPISSTGAMTGAERARRARSKDLMALMVLGNEALSEISISGLISLLPKLFSDKKKRGLARLVLMELVGRL